MAEGVAAISRQTLDAQLGSVRVIEGAERGRWTILRYDFPHLYVRVTATAPGATFSQDFHLECDGFPDPGPFVERWKFAENASWGERPPPPNGGCPSFVDALKDWNEGGQSAHGGIYRGWQRLAALHNGWAAKFPYQMWNLNLSIIFILEHLHALVSEQADWLASQAA